MEAAGTAAREEAAAILCRARRAAAAPLKAQELATARPCMKLFNSLGWILEREREEGREGENCVVLEETFLYFCR